ncbi:MAG: SAM-dependent methyltransferase [Leptolyngbya sp. SIOISBB]|nr:SAM-dependent methyltransferase [Leptolyngbya sp. SIOISBB]
MAITLDTIVPWGRSYAEYVAMFNLTEADLTSRILGCADGPAAFNAVMTQQGNSVISVDPLYNFSAAEIRSRIAETYDVILEQVRQSQADYVWQAIASVEALGQTRMQAMETFLTDYETGTTTGRYQAESLPNLPFTPRQFDLALVSHFLFLYSEHLSYEFHVRSLQTLLHVAQEVRIFPLLTLASTLSPYITAIQEHFTQAGHTVEIEPVQYEQDLRIDKFNKTII